MSEIIKIPCKCWNGENWVDFNIQTGEYQNFNVFLVDNKIGFLSTMEIDFTTIPVILHGKNRSRNLLDYLSNNNNDVNLILSFINYFISNISKIKYYTGINLNFNLINSSTWQTSKIYVSGYISPTTTTTTTTILPTTTLLPTTTGLPMGGPILFEIFGHLYEV